MTGGDALAIGGMAAAVGMAYFRPVREVYKWCVAYALLTRGTPLGRTIAHKMGYTYNEHGWPIKMKTGEQIDKARVAFYGRVNEIKAAEHDRRMRS